MDVYYVNMMKMKRKPDLKTGTAVVLDTVSKPNDQGRSVIIPTGRLWDPQYLWNG